MGEMVNKVVAAILTVAWAITKETSQTENEVIGAYEKFIREVR